MSNKNLSESAQNDTDLLIQLREKFVVQAQEQGLLEVAYRTVESPVGTLLLAGTDRGLVRLAFESENFDAVLQFLAQKVSPRILSVNSALDEVARQIEQYFSGQRQRFNVPLDLRLSTDFRRSVQLELDTIGYGQTMSYAHMAQQVGKPKAVRAVGSACATNPLPIVLPCHRVLRTDGSLGGYLGGLEVKEALLRLENPDYGQQKPTLF